jgi:hypothetical protein
MNYFGTTQPTPQPNTELPRSFFPILGELSRTHFVLILVTFDEQNITIEYNNVRTPIQLIPLTCTKVIFDLPTKAMDILILVNTNIYKIPVRACRGSIGSFKIVNCDCQFTPEVGLWEEIVIGDAETVFHLGDQIYLDLVFMRLAKTIEQHTDESIKRIVYEEYRLAFQRKAHVLQTAFNVMLADDHEVADETIRTKYPPDVVSRLVRIFENVYHEIQNGLRQYNSKTIVLNDKAFILADNIRALNDDDYSRYIYDLIHEEIPKSTTSHIYILTPRVPMNNRLSSWVNTIFGKTENTNNYQKLYDFITGLLGRSTTIVCGDEHAVKQYTVTTRYGKCRVFFAGPINSPPDPYDSDDYVNGCHTETIYSLRINGYMNEDKHITKETGCCHCAYFSYIRQYLCARWC